MSTASTIDMSLVRQWVNTKLSPDHIEGLLKSSGHDPESILAHIKAFKKERHARRSITGFILMGIGAFMGFLSCVLSIVNPIPELYYYILYGFTSLAILVICAGLYYAFE